MINLCVPPVHQVHPEVPGPALDKGDEALPLDPHQQGQAQACQEHGRYRVQFTVYTGYSTVSLHCKCTKYRKENEYMINIVQSSLYSVFL